MFDVQEVFDKCKAAGLTDVYVGFKIDAVKPQLIILKISCDHPSGKGRVTQQVVYSRLEWPVMVNYIIGKLQRTAKTPWENLNK